MVRIAVAALFTTWRCCMGSRFLVVQDKDDVDWVRLAEIFEKAPFAKRNPPDIQRAFENSYTSCFAYDDTLLIGAARALSDGVYYAIVFDVVVAIEYQGMGVGRTLMGALLKNLPFDKIFLTAPPDKQGFYRKFGFYKHNNAMGRYAHPEQAFEYGVLSRWEQAATRTFWWSKPSYEPRPDKKPD